jgi:hypothetical protein
MDPCAQLYSLAETPPPPPHLGSYTRALLVSQDRRHLFVTPCLYGIGKWLIFKDKVNTESDCKDVLSALEHLNI